MGAEELGTAWRLRLEKQILEVVESLLFMLRIVCTLQHIIENCELRGRVTTIPLNRIKSKPVQPQVQKADVELVRLLLSFLTYFKENTYITKYISHVGEGNVEFALLLVSYANEVKVAFDRQVKTRSVTSEGDLFQSGGVMSGGPIRCTVIPGEWTSFYHFLVEDNLII
ncbi:RecF/RecN/SMC [Artemisia annua]|uniref:RecF/RecN/SMC n=1 Tax=Artemisia annua TaxID=35608 RepID=A0A2U1KQT3_ARTAN|nr:RecF/RecN/SMC [Artemisia annua]